MNPNDPILPSSLLSEADQDYYSTFNYNFNNFSLKIGLVKKSYNIDDKENTNKKMPEYDVLVFEQHGDQGVASTTYPRCIFLDTFGGLGDFFEFKKRNPTDEQLQDPANSDGSTVLMLCVDGVAEKGLIIGAIPHPNRKTTLTKDAGHHLEGEFNGLNWQVNKDGALTVTFQSATDNKGIAQDQEAGGTAWKIEKDGSIELTDGATEKIRIDKTTKKIDIESEDDISITSSKKNVNIIAKESINLTATQDLIAMAEGKAAFTVNKTFDIEAKGAASMKAQSFMFESKSMINMKAQSLISIKAMSSLILQAPQVVIGKGTSPALKSLETVTLGTGFAGVPVISTVIAGYSTEVLIS